MTIRDAHIEQAIGEVIDYIGQAERERDEARERLRIHLADEQSAQALLDNARDEVKRLRSYLEREEAAHAVTIAQRDHAQAIVDGLTVRKAHRG